MQEHLMIHLMDQIFTLGPLYLHTMFPYRARPEGSIMESYLTEEVVECYADYVKDGNR
jgi:hypothetical protein